LPRLLVSQFFAPQVEGQADGGMICWHWACLNAGAWCSGLRDSEGVALALSQAG